MKFIIIDVNSRSLSSNGKAICLTEKEFLLFECIIGSLTKQAININEVISHVWRGREITIGRLNISQLIFRLRRKLEYLDDSADISFSMMNGVSSFYLSRCIVLKSNSFTRVISSLFM